MTGPKDIAIVIPARNEADRIIACLGALADQSPARTTLVLMLNSTDDDTHGIARRFADTGGLDLHILDRMFRPSQGVGTARRLGCDHALRSMPHLRFLLTTDADCVVAPDWVASNLSALEMADVVCGRIGLIATEAGILTGMDTTLATHEGAYRQLVQKTYARHGENCADLAATHGEAAGASLAFRKDAYLAVGGFAPDPCGEDRRIVRDLRASGHRVRHADDVVVRASCRLTGRAAGGMSDALKLRITGTDYLIDDCLPGADWLIDNAGAGTLGPWPPHVPLAGRVHVRDLPLHIDALNAFLTFPRDPARSASAALPATGPVSHNRVSLADRGSAPAPADPALRPCSGDPALRPCSGDPALRPCSGDPALRPWPVPAPHQTPSPLTPTIERT